jgi:hypothetical protein
MALTRDFKETIRARVAGPEVSQGTFAGRCRSNALG